jgi:hypothetical protein
MPVLIKKRRTEVGKERWGEEGSDSSTDRDSDKGNVKQTTDRVSDQQSRGVSELVREGGRQRNAAFQDYTLLQIDC